MGRRAATKRALTVLGAAAIAPGLLAACGGDDGDGELSCSDTTGLEPAQITTRQAQNYVEQAANAEEKCSNCRFYTAAAAGECGGCQVIAGPIHPDGGCDLWAAQS